MSTRLTVAEIVRTHLKDFVTEFGLKLPRYILYALTCIGRCRTAALGGKKLQCQNCGHESVVYNSCRHRACPQCENQASSKWMEARAKDLLPVHYFHIVFTLPHVFNELLLANKKLCLSIFFAAVQKTLLTVGRNNIKAKVGFFSILHTWGQKLDLHPHIHCIVPGGGISLDGTQWVQSSKKKRYFASSKVMAIVFQGIFIRALKKAYRQGKFDYSGNFEDLLKQACQTKWVVHSQAPFCSPIFVLKYLSRYVRKIAIANSRLISMKDGSIEFSVVDYADGAKKKTLTLRAFEFIRRFVLHIPPPHFVRIRHCGFLANSVRKKSLALCLEFISSKKIVDYAKHYRENIAPGKCTICQIGSFLVTEVIAPQPQNLNSS